MLTGRRFRIAGTDVFRSENAREHSERPSWRWLLAGPPGSGTQVHQDPWGYSSWNASCVGTKRWVFFPPSVRREELQLEPAAAAATGANDSEDYRRVPPAYWWAFTYPELRRRGLPMLEAVQRPGDTIYVPPRWWQPTTPGHQR